MFAPRFFAPRFFAPRFFAPRFFPPGGYTPRPGKRLWPIGRSLPLFAHRPFSGQGVSVYAAPSSDTLVYRRLRIIGSRPPIRVSTEFPVDKDSVSKTARIASQSGSAGAAVEATVDLSAFADDEIQIDVRHYNGDIENGVISPRRITLDGSGDQVDEIRGVATLLTTEVRAGGVVRIRWRWVGAPTGVQPDEFVVARTAGPTSPSDVTVTSVGDRIYSADTPALSDSSAYTYKVTAQTTGGGTARDVLTDITFTADATGPASPGSFTVTTA